MKLCIVPTMFPKYKGDYYGSFVYDEAKKLVENGIEVHVLTQHNHGIPYEEIMDGIHVHRFRWLEPKEFRALVHFKGLKDNLRLLTYVISLFFNLVKIIKKYKINIIHAHSVIPTGLIGVIVAKIMGCPSFITAHGMDINNFDAKSIYGHLISFSLKHCDKAIAVSGDLAETMKSLGITKDKIVILRNAVDTNRFKPFKNMELRHKYGVKENELLILFVGYLDTFKGIFELVDAFYGINKENKNVKLMMVGTGLKKDEIKKKISQLGLKSYVMLIGTVPHAEIHSYYQMADVFVLPSHTEGFPLSVLEAMACKIPVLVTDVGGISEIIENGLNGFVVVSNDEHELTNKLKIITKDKNLRNDFANKSYEIIRNSHFDMGDKIKVLKELYSYMVNK
ncbi:glycosyltransferase [Methanobacterium paludis]|uniref:Glycosyl transferase group 1 n=1 Tax=Methanobacterium paludis (strain DSM 25820 / JCM 18151 / SWAN1) TaxID=868131 RepID=F6D8A4_METPW|nr:glycosyltransferase [Methanobacterium paludis]AEG18538.1 glycosyl transferase group 1 [Methanobacterium paludis]